MAKTLAELTLELSKNLEALEKECARERSRMESERDKALKEIPKARDILERYHAGLEKAHQTKLETIQRADEARLESIAAAEDKRRRAIVEQDRKHAKARRKADQKERDQAAKARTKWREAVADVSARPLEQRRKLRRDADETLELALEAIREAHLFAIEDARLEHRAALQDALVDERIEADAANRHAERIITAAAIDYERAVAQEEAKMRSKLAGYDVAREIQANYDRRLSHSRETCERAKEELFREFTRERRRLERPTRAKSSRKK